MLIQRIVCVLCLFVSAVTLLGQDPAVDEQKWKIERRAKLIERIQADVEQLKLPENRALINSKIGAAIWETDKNAAKALFRAAMAELIAAQQYAESNKSPNNPYHDLIQSQSLRPQIINAIAGTDAEYALEQLYKSRPAAVERAMAGDRQTAKFGSPAVEQAHLAQSEINLEQRLMKMVADQKPERALAILKESLRKRLSGETLGLLQKLYGHDPTTASELSNDVLDRLNREKFFTEAQANHELINLSNSILAEFARERGPEEKYLRFDEPRVRMLAVKVIETYLNNSQRIGYIPFEQLEPAVKRFAPGAIEQLKKLSIGLRGYGHHAATLDPEYKKLMESNPSPDLIVSEAKKYPIDIRRSMYMDAANKFSESGEYQNAMALLKDHFEGEALSNAVSSMAWGHVHQLIQKGQFDAAESVILEFNENNRVSALISLAHTIYGAEQELNKARAIATMNRARAMIPGRPENNNELSQLFNVINAMATIEPSEAFREFEPLIDDINRVIEASAIVNAFQGGNLRQGEYVLSGGFSFGVYVDPNVLRSLAKNDYERTETLINMFSKPEVRIMLKIFVAEGGLM